MRVGCHSAAICGAAARKERLSVTVLPAHAGHPLRCCTREATETHHSWTGRVRTATTPCAKTRSVHPTPMIRSASRATLGRAPGPLPRGSSSAKPSHSYRKGSPIRLGFNRAASSPRRARRRRGTSTRTPCSTLRRRPWGRRGCATGATARRSVESRRRDCWTPRPDDPRRTGSHSPGTSGYSVWRPTRGRGPPRTSTRFERPNRRRLRWGKGPRSWWGAIPRRDQEPPKSKGSISRVRPGRRRQDG